MTAAGIPVMAHIGFTPQSEHALGGYRVQGRGDAADEVLADARAVTEAGAFAVVLEMVPGDVAKRVTAEVPIPTIGIGAGPHTDAQVLVWQDMAGLRGGKMPRFVKRYAEIGALTVDAIERYAAEVRAGAFPGPEHVYAMPEEELDLFAGKGVVDAAQRAAQPTAKEPSSPSDSTRASRG